MSVFKRGTVWMSEFQAKGKRYTKSGFLKKKDAQDWEVAKQKSLERQTTAMDLEGLCNRRLDYVEEQKTPLYYTHNRKICEAILTRWGNPPLSEITRDMVEDYLSTIQRPHMRNYTMRLLKALFNHAVEREWLLKNPVKRVKPIRADKKRKRIPTNEELAAVLAVAEPHERHFLLVLKNTLARFSEVGSLQWEDVNLQSRTVTLWTRKKARGELTPRIIPMTDELFETVKSLRYDWYAKHEEDPHGHVFINPNDDQPYKCWNKMLQRLCAKAKIPAFTYHCLRHRGASVLVAKGVPLSDLQAILGHENLTTTQIYVQSLVGSTSQSIHRLND